MEPQTPEKLDTEYTFIRKEIAALRHERRSDILQWWILAICGASAIFIFSYVYLGHHEMLSYSHNDGTIIFSLLPFMYPFMKRSSLDIEATKRALPKIAASLGYTYQAVSTVGVLDGFIFSGGDTHEIYEVFSGMHDSFPVRMYRYQFSKRRKGFNSPYVRTVFELTYPSELQHIVLLPYYRLNDSSDTLKALDSLRLEGNFNDTFSLFVEKDAQSEVREILTPDVMQYLMDAYGTFIIETKGNKLYFYQNSLIDRISLNARGIELFEKIKSGLRSSVK